MLYPFILIARNLIAFFESTIVADVSIVYWDYRDGLRQRKWLIWLSVYVGLGFIGSELALFLICRPLSNYWAVPTPNREFQSGVFDCFQ